MSPTRIKKTQQVQASNARKDTRPFTRAYKRQLALTSSGIDAPESIVHSALRSGHSSKCAPTQKQQQPQRYTVETNHHQARFLLNTQRPCSPIRKPLVSSHSPDSQSRYRIESPQIELASAPPVKLRRSARIASARRVCQKEPTGSLHKKPNLLTLPLVRSRRTRKRKHAISDTGSETKNSRLEDRPHIECKSSPAPPRRVRQASRSLANPSSKPTATKTKSERTHNQEFVSNIEAQSGDIITTWLHHISADVLPNSPQDPHDLSFQMPPRTRGGSRRGDSSSSVTNESKSSSIAPDDTRSNNTGATAKGKPKPSDNVRLRQHFIEIKSSQDPHLAMFGIDTLLNHPIRHLDLYAYRSFIEAYEENGQALRRLLPEAAGANTFSEVDAFAMFDLALQKLYEWRAPGRPFRTWPGVTENQFRLDQLHCLETNEANFQRTSMMSMVDRYDFQDHFAFSCEECWSTGDHRMPAIMKDVAKIPAPRPDLMICFTGESIEPNDLIRTKIPDWLGPCFWPVSGRDLSKMFPFFFIEVKRGDSSLKGGFERNLNSASQALYNIYQLMQHYPDLKQDFFQRVRVFTLDANVSDMNLRVHRAELSSDGSGVLMYKFFEFEPIKAYGRINVCHSVKTVLLEYGLEKLLPIFRSVFQRISEDPPAEPSSAAAGQGTKRKQSTGGDGTAIAIGHNVIDLDISQGTTDGGSETPRNLRSPTQLTGSFNSVRFGLPGDTTSQLSPKKTKSADTGGRNRSEL